MTFTCSEAKKTLCVIGSGWSRYVPCWKNRPNWIINRWANKMISCKYQNHWFIALFELTYRLIGSQLSVVVVLRLQIAVQTLWNIKIAVLVKPEHENRISHVGMSSVKTGIANTLGNRRTRCLFPSSHALLSSQNMKKWNNCTFKHWLVSVNKRLVRGYILDFITCDCCDHTKKCNLLASTWCHYINLKVHFKTKRLNLHLIIIINYYFINYFTQTKDSLSIVSWHFNAIYYQDYFCLITYCWWSLVNKSNVFILFVMTFVCQR